MATRMKTKAAERQANKDTRPYATARYVRMSCTKAKRYLSFAKQAHAASFSK